MDSIKVGGLPSSFYTALLQFQILTRLLSRPRSWVNSLQAAAAAHMTDKPDIFEAAQNGSIVLLNSHIVMDPACVTRRDDRSIALLLNLCFVFLNFRFVLHRCHQLVYSPQLGGAVRPPRHVQAAGTRRSHQIATAFLYQMMLRMQIRCNADVDAKDMKSVSFQKHFFSRSYS